MKTAAAKYNGFIHTRDSAQKGGITAMRVCNPWLWIVVF